MFDETFEEESFVDGEEDFDPLKEGQGRPKSRKRVRPKRRTTRFSPGERQKKQPPAERIEDRQYYRKNRAKRLWYQNLYYDVNKDTKQYEKALEYRQEHPNRRRRASAEKISRVYWANFFVIDRSPPEDSPGQWRDLEPWGTPSGKFDPISIPEGTTTWVDGEAREHKIPGHPLGIDSYGGPGSSAKVIPYSSDLVNNKNWMVKNASMSMDQILAATNEDIVDRGHDYWPVLYRKGPLFLYFKVGDYRVRCHFSNLSLEAFRGDSLPEDLNIEDVHFDCSCKFWRWQGPEHWARAYGYDLTDPRGTASLPEIRDPEGTKLVCKHVASVINYLLFL